MTLVGIGVVLDRKLPWIRRRLRDARLTTRVRESIRRTVAPHLPAVWSRRRQTAYNWLSATVVVREK
ncbi:MAG: hypothetical protein WAL63_02310 [Solirubrobacteraceae bacterium]